MAIPPEKIKEIKQLIVQGKLLNAIKMYREISGVGLKEAKDVIQSLSINEAN